jgi:hypothetical protein
MSACTRGEAPTPPTVPPSNVAPTASFTPPSNVAPSGSAKAREGSTSAVSADGRVSILGRGEYAVHDHGGPPAHIGSASFEVHNQRERPLRVSVRDIEWLVGSGCNPPRAVAAHPALGELRLGRGGQGVGASVTVPTKSKVDIEVGYAWQEAYMTFCDRFATRVIFDVEGEAIPALAEHHVVRRTPLSRP